MKETLDVILKSIKKTASRASTCYAADESEALAHAALLLAKAYKALKVSSRSARPVSTPTEKGSDKAHG